mmetsp:Transcript_94647/g.131549  ORF Transcript_94647/g.131549 Transcript_94647/m.131549 type:complete len:253 (-) Transcript_94647:22-780(-)
MTMAEVILVLTLILGTIWPSHGARSRHMTFLPCTSVDTPVREVICALAVHTVCTELSLVDNLAIGRCVGTLTMFASLEEFTFILRAICPLLHALARLFVLEPLPYVGASIFVGIGSLSLCAVLVPVTFIHVSIRSFEFSVAMGSAILEVSFIGGSIGPCQNTLTMALRAQPLSLVLCTSLNLCLWSLNQVPFLNLSWFALIMWYWTNHSLGVVLILPSGTASKALPEARRWLGYRNIGHRGEPCFSRSQLRL